MTSTDPRHESVPRSAETRRRTARRVVVVGSGVAGLTAALHAREAGARVTIVTKSVVNDTATAHAQGGIAAVVFPDDTHASHEADTIRAAAGLADSGAVRTLVTDGTHRVAELIDRGVAFDRDESGRLARGLEGAHSVARVLHAGGDATGAEIQRGLAAAVRAAGIAVREHAALVDLVGAGDLVSGARFVSPSGAISTLAADAVVLATGGAGRVYARTTNPAGATGDGIAAAVRVGARIRDMEFVQFHPTVLDARAPFLVSEAVRGAGATLIDERGERFAFASHPDGELAPRDVVARAIAERMADQEGRPVRLDASALGARFLARRFPTIDRAVRESGYDWARAPFPVAPAAHYLMGGVATDLDGRTSVPGLYAAGEVARTGVHGANRLASNSLLEGAVFGARVGRAAAVGGVRACATTSPPGPAPADRTGPRRRSAKEPRPGGFDRATLGTLMWRRAGLARDADGLHDALTQVDGWLRTLPDPHLPREVEDRSLLIVAREILRASLRRSGSVGAHVRTDTARAPASA